MRHILAFVVSCLALIFGHVRCQTNSCPDPCPDGVSVKGNCYKLYNLRKNWADAQAFCIEQGGQLAAVHSSVIQVAIENYLERAKFAPYLFQGEAWIGGRLQNPMNITNNYKRMWRWVADCSDCSLFDEMTLKAVEKQGCFNDWASEKDYVPQELQGKVLKETCDKTCSDLDLRFSALSKPQLSAQPDFCYCNNTFGRRGGDNTWKCNDICKDDPDEACGGVNKNLVYLINGQYAAWDRIAPKAKFLECGVLNRQFGSGLAVDTVPCTSPRKYICELPTSQCAYCPCNSSCNGSSFIQERVTVPDEDWSACVYVGPIELDWFRARQVCADRGGDLLVLDSEAKHETVLQVLREADPVGESPVFLGLYRDNYYWDDGTDLGGKAMTYSNFAQGFPRNETAECINVNQNATREWATTDCTTKMAFICQVQRI